MREIQCKVLRIVRLAMEFGSSYVYAAKESEAEFELVAESRYNHVVKGFSSAAGSGDYKDDGEVCPS